VGHEARDHAVIYQVGGASLLPTVGRMLREHWGRRVHRSPYPHAAVAMGLAIAAEERTRTPRSPGD
jgi:molecular chaperone DnaK (HSP70)